MLANSNRLLDFVRGQKKPPPEGSNRLLGYLFIFF
jgi:hypothetical protein